MSTAATITHPGTEPRHPLNAGSGLLDYLLDRSVFACTDGYVPALTGPGLGIEIDTADVERAATKAIGGGTPLATGRRRVRRTVTSDRGPAGREPTLRPDRGAAVPQ